MAEKLMKKTQKSAFQLAWEAKKEDRRRKEEWKKKIKGHLTYNPFGGLK